MALLLLQGHARARADVHWLWDRTWPAQVHAPEVALLSDNIEIFGGGLRQRPRLAMPQLATDTRVTPVVHVELNVLHPPKDPSAYHSAVVDAVLRAARRSTSGWVQLDYEARPSSRAAWRALVTDLRRQLPPDVRLSVTALAWWCQGPAWLDQLPADEVVPMFFRMGRDSKRIMQILRDEPHRLHRFCRSGSAGMARQESELHDLAGRYARVYWFDYDGWKDAPRWNAPAL